MPEYPYIPKRDTKVWIANAAYSLKQILEGSVPSTRVSLEG